MQNKVLLVDKNDKVIGVENKLTVHINAKLHRAFSILVFNNDNELLIQQRALDKYHTPGLWSNTCCSHQQPGETTLNAAHNRLREEMGFICSLKETHKLIYKLKIDTNLWEYEYNHVLIGSYDGIVKPNPLEVSDHRWISFSDLSNELSFQYQKYTPWFKLILKRYFLPRIKSGTKPTSFAYHFTKKFE